MVEGTDKYLCEQILLGDEGSFRRLFEKYRDPVYGYAFSLTRSSAVAADAVQETFLKIWLRRDRLNPELSVGAYIYRSVRNYVFDHLKKTARDEQARLQLFGSGEPASPAADLHLLTKELNHIRHQAVESLPAQRQRIYKMSRVDGLSHQQIAAELGISVNTVKDQVTKATRHIREYLQKHAELELLPASLAVLLTLW